MRTRTQNPNCDGDRCRPSRHPQGKGGQQTLTPDRTPAPGAPYKSAPGGPGGPGPPPHIPPTNSRIFPPAERRRKDFFGAGPIRYLIVESSLLPKYSSFFLPYSPRY